MQITDRRQIIQDDDYAFPYHYVPQFAPGYTQTYSWPWALHYLGAMEFILEQVKALKPESVADVGTGDGRLVRELATSLPGVKVVGIDYSSRAVQLAKALNPGLEFHSMDIIAETPDEPFHVVTLIEVFEHIPPALTANFVKALRAFVRDDGHLIVTVPHSNVPTSVKHFQHFSSATLQSAFAAHFTAEEIHFLDRKSRFVTWLKLFLENKYFILTHWGIRNRLYNFYKRKFVKSTENECQRIYIRFRPKHDSHFPSHHSSTASLRSG